MAINKKALMAAAALSIAPLVSEAQTRAAIASLPTGFGMSGGNFAVSLSGLYTPNGPRRLDGDLGLAVGFGDPVNAVGVTLSADITSLENDFADSGFFNVGAHRQFRFSGGYGSVNATISGIGAYGTAAARQVGGSLVASLVTGTASRPYMVTAGLANDMRLTGDLQGILGFGMGLNENWAVSAGVYGDNSAIGVTYFPPFLRNGVVQVSLRNLNDPVRRGIGVSIGYGFNLFGN